MALGRVEIETRIPGGLLGEPERLILEFPLEESLTVEDLIRFKVEEERRRLVAMQTLDQRSPGSDHLGREYQDLETLRAPQSACPDLAGEVHKARQAFHEGRFLVLVDGQRYTQLDARITLAPQSSVKFIRLMPLTGG